MGTNCETEINECDPMPCQNGGTCTVNFFFLFMQHRPLIIGRHLNYIIRVISTENTLQKQPHVHFYRMSSTLTGAHVRMVLLASTVRQIGMTALQTRVEMEAPAL